MPVCFALAEDLDLVYIDPQGATATMELLHCIEEYAQEPAFHPKMDVLLDLRGMASYEPGEDATIEQITRTIDRTRGSETGYRLACVVRSDNEETFIEMGDDVLYRADEVASFYELSEALRWLGRTGAEKRIEQLRERLEAAGPAANETGQT